MGEGRMGFGFGKHSLDRSQKDLHDLPVVQIFFGQFGLWLNSAVHACIGPEWLKKYKLQLCYKCNICVNWRCASVLDA